jgi:hypothetical protein
MASFLLGAGKPFFIASPAIWFAERAEGVKDRNASKLSGVPLSRVRKKSTDRRFAANHWLDASVTH